MSDVKRKRSASMGSMEQLHKAVADYMLNRIESSTSAPDAEPEYDEDGNPIDEFFIPLAASELQVMVSFLKNNNVTASPDDASMGALKSEFDEDMRLKREQAASKIIHDVGDDRVASFLS